MQEDTRSKECPEAKYILKRLRPHQIQALKKLYNGKILKGGVGSGKTWVAIAYYILKESPKDLYVFTTAKKRDDLEWEGVAAKFAISRLRENTAHGTITVDSWNNITKYTELKDSFVIFDEQRLVGSGAWVKAFYKISKVNRWIMLSATPGEVGMDYIPVFVANGFYKNKTEFVRTHVVYSNFSKFPKVERYVETGKLERLRREVLVDMPYERHTKRHIQFIRPTYNEDLHRMVLKDRWHIYEERPIRDVGEMFLVLRKLINSDHSRVERLLELTKKHKKLIIFYNFNYELEILREVAESAGIPYSEWNGHKHEPTKKTDSWLYLVQYTAGAEGWNCIETNSMVFWSLTYSYKLYEQAQGRIDRLNTPFVDLYYYVMMSSSPMDRAIWKALRSKQNFSEASYIRKEKINA